MVELKLHICGYTIMSGSKVTKTVTQVIKVVNLNNVMYPKNITSLYFLPFIMFLLAQIWITHNEVPKMEELCWLCKFSITKLTLC